MTTYYITKYALTKGILEIDTTKMKSIEEDGEALMVWGHSSGVIFYHHGEWFTNRKDAIHNANARIKKKIPQLRKQIEKFENMEFI